MLAGGDTMKNRFIVILTLFSALYATSSLANEPNNQNVNMIYSGVAFAFPSFDVEDGNGNKFKTTDMMFGALVGYRPIKNVSVELRFYGDANPNDVHTNQHYNVAGLYTFPLDQYLDIYGMAGYGKTEVEALGNITEESGIIYGVGFSISKGTPLKLNLEWQHIYLNNDSLEGSQFNANVMFFF